VSCGEVHSQARELVAQGYTATLVATALLISRSSLYYRNKPRGSRADRTYDEQIVVACGEKLAWGYRRARSSSWRGTSNQGTGFSAGIVRKTLEKMREAQRMRRRKELLERLRNMKIRVSSSDDHNYVGVQSTVFQA